MMNYLLLDAARMKEQFSTVRELGVHFDCLYEDRSRDDLAEVAPYLCIIDEKAKHLQDWIIEDGLGDSWGTWVVSNASFDTVISHFRQFLIIKVRDRERYFRFYDPRVLKKILPAYDREQLSRFFGPVEKFIVEGDTKAEAIVFTQRNGILKQETVPAGDIFQDIMNQQSGPLEHNHSPH